MDKIILAFKDMGVSFTPAGDGNVMFYSQDGDGRSFHMSYGEFRQFVDVINRLPLVAEKEQVLNRPLNALGLVDAQGPRT